ncbi:hypothetical protein ACJMK2_022199 [Sinanodonta woodiana]|uniref:C-type lectin domain-containing protein n=1 Tax=Sinanodonta woodiana TaxID=1069815 RepID=A0ABD3TKC0_SINWO
MVEWSQAEQTCQKNNGTLFKPNVTSFDVSLFSNCNFKDELWVAATYINVSSFESASIPIDSVLICEMCTVGERCKTTCLYKGCWNQCRAACNYIFEPHIMVLSGGLYNWNDAKMWCSGTSSVIGDKIENASSLFFKGYCEDICFWTRNWILVSFQTTLANGSEPGECGILRNGTISFTSCKRYLQPLCETVSETALETPLPSFRDVNNSCILGNNTITYTTTTEASNSQINATISTSFTYGTSIVTNESTERATFGEELSSLLVSIKATTSRNDLEDSSHKSDIGIIIGAVIGSVVFLMVAVIVIICFRRKLLKRTGESNSKHDSQNMTMKTTHQSIYSYGRCDVPLNSESGPFDQLESKCEGSSGDIVKQKSNAGKSADMIDPEESNANYATDNTNENVNLSNLTFNINYESFDHLHTIPESKVDNVAENIYDNRF